MSIKRKKLGITNDQIARTATKALIARDFVTVRGNCLRFVREVVTATRLGAWPLKIGPNAWEAYKLLKAKGYEVPIERGSVVGDLLFKAPTKNNHAGHVGIRISGNRVAENSSYHASTNIEDARGVRTLKEFGKVAAIIRLGD